MSLCSAGCSSVPVPVPAAPSCTFCGTVVGLLGLGLGLSRDCEVTSQGGVKCKERMQSDLHDECCAGRRESLSLGVGPHRATPVEEEQFLIDQV